MCIRSRVGLGEQAFSKMPNKKLLGIGAGNVKVKIQHLAGDNLSFLSHLDFDQFHYYMRKAKAFVFAGKEDFGITLVEAQACGTPLIAYHKGGAAEIVKHGETGLLFRKQTTEAIIDSVEEFENEYESQFSAWQIRENAERFSTEEFNQRFSSFMKKCVS
jgi:glycosyltransferase involved in cell wall biosynthesis